MNTLVHKTLVEIDEGMLAGRSYRIFRSYNHFFIDRGDYDSRIGCFKPKKFKDGMALAWRDYEDKTA